MKLSSEILLGIALGILFCLPLGIYFPTFESGDIPVSSLIINGAFGGVGGYLMGVRFLNDKNKFPNKYCVFYFTATGMLSIGLTTILKMDNGSLLLNINLPAVFFLFFGLSMLVSAISNFINSDAPNKSLKQDKKQLVFARASLILTNYFIAS